ncbi:MAG: hypothetical protein A3K68_01620 [Euryarchaeota archaeon RBG_16_68_13]|nr:MAG: hypothetical protein A3K68_01620 [Euryarchaeota archaeon RBG_16_68_13]
MPRIRVVLAEPKNEGNVGAVARAMRNFDVEELVLVNPPPLGDEARKRAMHGAAVLDAARTVGTLAAALDSADLVVGTSGVDTTSEKKFARISLPPRDLAFRLAAMKGTVAIVFGREDFGLLDEEIRACDLLVTIPASPGYPVLNLSHAATILLYELFASRTPARRKREASGMEKERLFEALADLMDATEYPAHKRDRTTVMFRRVMGRAVPSKWEFHALMGVFQRATKRIRRLEGKR